MVNKEKNDAALQAMVKRTLLPRPSLKGRVGSTKSPYHVRDPRRTRRAAIKEAIDGMVYKDTPEKNAVVKKKLRMSLIRIFQKKNPVICKAIESDMRWLNRFYGYGGKTTSICEPKKIKRKT